MAQVVYLVQDLLFVSKIRETARQLGLEAVAARDPAGLCAAAQTARLVIVDLRRPDAMEALDRLCQNPAAAATSRVGFVDHERVEVMEAARARGCRALAKGRFTAELPALFGRLR